MHANALDSYPVSGWLSRLLWVSASIRGSPNLFIIGLDLHATYFTAPLFV
jgi:hypothetical protein